MKSSTVFFLAAVVGTASGVGLATWRHKTPPWDGTPEGSRRLISPEDAAKLQLDFPQPEGIPQAVVDHEDFDFGLLSSGATGTHDFVITNKGDGPLRLTEGHTTCKCTMANLDHAEVPPGGSTTVHLEFQGKGFSGAYRQTATVITNDPARQQIALTVSGKIVPVAKAVPDEVVFTSISAGESASATVDFFNYTSTPLKLAGHEFTETNSAPLFEVKIEPMKPDVIAKEPGAKGGVHVHVTIKPGLPVGAIKQTIRLKTNLAGAEQYGVDVRGSVVSDLAIVGGDWNEEHGRLTVGTVSAKEETSRRLYVIARGPLRDQVQLKVAELSPSFLKVDFEPPASAGQGLRRLPIVIRIPKGTPPADHLGTESGKIGRIVLETNHPRAPKLLIRVRFAVQN